MPPHPLLLLLLSIVCPGIAERQIEAIVFSKRCGEGRRAREGFGLGGYLTEADAASIAIAEWMAALNGWACGAHWSSV